MFPLTSATMVTSDVINTSSATATTEKPYAEFSEVRIATLIDRVYIPFVVIVGLVFNSLCFVTFVFTSLRTTSTSVYMAAIAALDSTVLLLSLCGLIRRYVGDTTFYQGHTWACGINFLLFYFTIHFDVLVILAMTVDRFIVVRFPLKAQRLSTPKSAIRVIAGVGLFCLAINVHMLFNRRLVPSGNAADPQRCWYPEGDIKEFIEKYFTIIDASIYSFIPFVSLLSLNLLIIRQLRQAHKFSKQFTETRDTKILSTTGNGKIDSDKDGGAGSVRKSMTSTNINVMFLLVSFTFLLLTSPVVILLLYSRHYWQRITNAEKAHFRLIRVCVNSLMFSNHGVNFLLYCISGRRFRQELKKLFTRFCSRS